MKSKESVLVVKNVCKKFSVKRVTSYGGIAKSGVKPVLNNLSFDLQRGEVLGLIGKNGCGKSTLLKILTNIMKPDKGSIKSTGKIASVLELNMGFDPESSGYENIRIKCGLYGLSSSQTDAVIDDIVSFSELGEQINDPLRTYSSGMVAKLAFSVLIHIKCDILIIDEVLSVGDASFNIKCKQSFQQMKKRGCSIIVASHNISSIEELSDRVLWIEDGTTKEIGDPSVVCYHYKYDTVNSIATVLKMAESGDLISINRAGIMFRDGIFVEKDIEKAELFFTKAADMGMAEAQINLADLKIQNGDVASAEILYEKASQTGNPVAIMSLMQLKEDSSILSSLISSITELANNSNVRAMKLLADLYYQGHIVNKDVSKSIDWYLKCSEYNNNQSEYTLGICYRDGIGVPVDPDKSVYYLRRSSEHGNNRARVELANMYRKGIGVERDVSEAIKWYEHAAQSGDLNSMIQLGLIYRDGLGIDSDPIKANYWFSFYSSYIISNYEFTFAEIIKQGFSLPRQAESIKWYEDSAKRGNIRSMNMLASIYRDGSITISNRSKALQYYQHSSSKEDSYGLYEYAQLLLSSDQYDIKEVLSLLERSCNQGNIYAMSRYLDILRTNESLHTNENIRYIQLLSESGNVSARLFLNNYSQLSK